jgi:hypothetical protein
MEGADQVYGRALACWQMMNENKNKNKLCMCILTVRVNVCMLVLACTTVQGSHHAWLHKPLEGLDGEAVERDVVSTRRIIVKMSKVRQQHAFPG